MIDISKIKKGDQVYFYGVRGILEKARVDISSGRVVEVTPTDIRVSFSWGDERMTTRMKPENLYASYEEAKNDPDAEKIKARIAKNAGLKEDASFIKELIQIFESKTLSESKNDLFDAAVAILKNTERDLSGKQKSGTSYNIGGNFSAQISGSIAIRKNYRDYHYGGLSTNWDMMLEIGNNIEGGGTAALKMVRDIFKEIADDAESHGATVKTKDGFMTIEKDGEIINVINQYATSFCWVGVKKEKSRADEGKTHHVPANTFTPQKSWEPSKGRDRDDPNWDWKNPNDNPSGEKPVDAIPHKYSGNPSDYPIIDDEFNRHLFDEDLVSHLKHEYGVKVWNKMSELEQIKAQLDFVSDPRAPLFQSDVRKYNKWLETQAKKLQSQIKRK